MDHWTYIFTLLFLLGGISDGRVRAEADSGKTVGATPISDACSASERLANEEPPLSEKRSWACAGHAYRIDTGSERALASGDQEKPEVLILTTGGTIAGGYRDTSKAGDALVSGVEGLEEVAEISVVEFSNIGSSNMTPNHRLRMARQIQTAFEEQPNLSGVVVTHGTDTLEETAYFLHLTILDPRPVIVTGAMRPPSAVGNDGPANLLDAVQAAATPESQDRSVLVAMSDKLYRAPMANKNHTTTVDAFVASEGGPVGTVPLFDSVRYEHPAAPEPLRGEFSSTLEQDRLPRVPIVYSYGGADGHVVRTQAERADGLVVAGTGQGHYGDAQEEAIDSAATNGTRIAVSSRTMAGPVPVGDSEEGVIGAGWLNPQKARILMSLSLAENYNMEETARLFRQTR